MSCILSCMLAMAVAVAVSHQFLVRKVAMELSHGLTIMGFGQGGVSVVAAIGLTI